MIRFAGKTNKFRIILQANKIVTCPLCPSLSLLSSIKNAIQALFIAVDRNRNGATVLKINQYKHIKFFAVQLYFDFGTNCLGSTFDCIFFCYCSWLRFYYLFIYFFPCSPVTFLMGSSGLTKHKLEFVIKNLASAA